MALANRYGKDDLEAACTRAVAHGDPAYTTIKRILQQGLHTAADMTPVYLPLPADTFARSAHELVGASLQEVVSWQ